MEITLTKPGKSCTQVTVIFEKEKVTPIEEEVIQALGKEVKIKGVRPGKAPLDAWREQIPASRIQEEVVQSVRYAFLDPRPVINLSIAETRSGNDSAFR